MRTLILALLIAVAVASQVVYRGELASARGSCRAIRVTLCNRFTARVRAAYVVKRHAFARLTFWQKRVAYFQAQLRFAVARVNLWTGKYRAAVAALNLAIQFAKTVCSRRRFHYTKRFVRVGNRIVKRYTGHTAATTLAAPTQSADVQGKCTKKCKKQAKKQLKKKKKKAKKLIKKKKQALKKHYIAKIKKLRGRARRAAIKKAKIAIKKAMKKYRKAVKKALKKAKKAIKKALKKCLKVNC